MLKRTFDVVLAGVALVVLSPVMAVLALIVKLDSPGTVFFRQVRVGRHGQTFTMYKFRTMRAPDSDTSNTVPQVSDFKEYVFDPLHGGKQYTGLGQFMRSTSLDELPNLMNVLRGDMSFVGPRPEVPEIVSQFPPDYLRRHDVRPGITGLAQINGRSDLTYHEAMLYDLDYTDRHPLLRDIAILLRTVPTVLGRKGAY